ncbi:MAG: acyl-CoA synthetase [Deltaproteobacteria bacterium]|nr:acyl-CoA synthetase [Deltaproteobacteria bacterium]
MTLAERSAVPAFVRSLAERYGDKPCICLGEQRLSYREIEARSRSWARGLLAEGVGKGTRIGLLMPNGPDWVTAWLAATRIGALLVPLNTFYQARELGWVLRHADVDTLLCVDRFLRNDYLERLEEFAPELAGAGPRIQVTALPYLRSVRVLGSSERPWTTPLLDLEAFASATPETLLEAVEDEVSPADPMVIIYSSGSTADPKGAVHTHGGVLRHSHNLNQFRDLHGEDRMYSPMPFFWVGGFVFNLLSALHVGASLVTEELFEPGRTLELLEAERVTILSGWPHYSAALVGHPSFPERDLSAVRGGNLYDLLPAEQRPTDPLLRSNSLGMTETCGPHTMDRMDRELPEKLRGSFGRAVPGLDHKIVDPETGATLGAGEFGEICVRGYSVAQGLYKKEREEVFDRDGYYHTGDGGQFTADGVLFFEARLGDLIKTAGANVTPREVEIVMEELPEVMGAYVVAVPHPERGENVAAAVVLREGAELTRGALRDALKRELSAYKLPRHVWFVESVPMTDSGKVDKRALAEDLAARIRAGDAGEPRDGEA